ncbi:hypothetical protein Dimus_038522 [Dionaea muscipula]
MEAAEQIINNARAFLAAAGGEGSSARTRGKGKKEKTPEVAEKEKGEEEDKGTEGDDEHGEETESDSCRDSDLDDFLPSWKVKKGDALFQETELLPPALLEETCERFQGMTTPAEMRMLERTPEDAELAAMYGNIGRVSLKSMLALKDFYKFQEFC